MHRHGGGPSLNSQPAASPGRYKQLKWESFSSFLVLNFKCFALFAQPSMPVEQIDSLFESVHVSENDWVISLSIEQAGTLPIYDSLGNKLYEDPQGSFLFLQVGRDHFLQKIWYEYLDNPFRSKVIIGNRLKLGKNVDINYSVDSILLAYKEWIYPFVYKNDSDNAYNVQQPADHEPYYGMHFKTANHDGSNKFFTETSLTESEVFLANKNLNYLYNSRTFVYRSFCKLINLIKSNTKAFTN